MKVIAMSLHVDLLSLTLSGLWCWDCVCWLQHCEYYRSADFSSQRCAAVSNYMGENYSGGTKLCNSYIPAKITIVAVNAAAIVVSTALRIIYGRRNSVADRLGAPARSRIETRLANKGAAGDAQDDESFRYVY